MPVAGQKGFTLIELLMAMAVFSFMLVIIIVGFINVVHIHNAALASNQAQDSARSAMETLVQAVRNSTGTPTITFGAAAPVGIISSDFDVLCLKTSTGYQDFYVIGSPAQLKRGDVVNCADTSPINVVPVTSTNELVSYFQATQQTIGPAIQKPEIQLQLTLGSSNGTAAVTGPTGASLQCNNNNADRVFCSTVTLTSGAVPR